MSKILNTKTRSQLAKELSIDLKRLKPLLQGYGIVLPPGPIYPPYQKWVYEWIAYPPEVMPADYEEVPMPELWMNKVQHESQKDE